MRASVDSVGRIVVPKALREALGLRAGASVDISRCGEGVQIVPVGRTARLIEEDGALVASGTTAIDDEDVFGLIDGQHGCALASRDGRAKVTYDVVGVDLLVVS